MVIFIFVRPLAVSAPQVSLAFNHLQKKTNGYFLLVLKQSSIDTLMEAEEQLNSEKYR